jgi:hypothetical protein
MKTISLESYEPSWDDAKTRLTVAAEMFNFPLFIVVDEVAYVTKSFDDYVADGEYPEDEIETLRTWWENFAYEVHGMSEAIETLYPWFHDGKDAPK